MAKVLITGIAGFIGSSLARALVQQGAQVSGIDNLSTGKMENLEDLSRQIDFVEGDILDSHAMASMCRGIDFVFHEAAIPSVPKSVEDPLGTNAANLQGTLVVLESARKAGVRRLMNAASSAVYGDGPELPKREDMLPAPISPYAVQKIASEHYCASYTRVYGLETVSLRYFNIFGPRQDPSSQYSGVLARFISGMLRGEAPTIFGDGLTSRDFTAIDNVVHANLLAAKAPGSAAGRVFNVATGQRTTLLQAVDAVRELTGFDGKVEFKPERDGDIKHSLASIAAAQQVLGYEVITDLRSGLKGTVEWYRQQTAPYASLKGETLASSTYVGEGRALQSL